MLELGRPLTLTWLEDGETVGVSAPVDIWLSRVILALPADIRNTVMDSVVAEVTRLNALEEEAQVTVEDEIEEDLSGPTGNEWHDQVLADHAAEEETDESIT